jgi:hypothetical protein
MSAEGERRFARLHAAAVKQDPRMAHWFTQKSWKSSVGYVKHKPRTLTIIEAAMPVVVKPKIEYVTPTDPRFEETIAAWQKVGALHLKAWAKASFVDGALVSGSLPSLKTPWGTLSVGGGSQGLTAKVNEGSYHDGRYISNGQWLVRSDAPVPEGVSTAYTQTFGTMIREGIAVNGRIEIVRVPTVESVVALQRFSRGPVNASDCPVIFTSDTGEGTSPYAFESGLNPIYLGVLFHIAPHGPFRQNHALSMIVKQDVGKKEPIAIAIPLRLD